MAYPSIARIEVPILHELVATGGVEDVRYLYGRLAGYFPQMTESEARAVNNRQRHHWKNLVQRAGRQLVEKRFIERERGRWTITQSGRARASEEASRFTLHDDAQTGRVRVDDLSHKEVQSMLMDIGRALGFQTESEFEYYDVVWREGARSPRLSHVFEVQRKGNIDAALAKLKRAYEAQRTKPYLIVNSERDTNRAHKALSQTGAGAFHEIERVTTILSIAQIGKLHRALTSIEELLAGLFER